MARLLPKTLTPNTSGTVNALPLTASQSCQPPRLGIVTSGILDGLNLLRLWPNHHLFVKCLLASKYRTKSIPCSGITALSWRFRLPQFRRRPRLEAPCAAPHPPHPNKMLSCTYRGTLDTSRRRFVTLLGTCCCALRSSVVSKCSCPGCERRPHLAASSNGIENGQQLQVVSALSRRHM